MAEKTIIVNDRPVFYRVVGQGQPVMLVHGFGEDGTIWENQEAALQRNYRLIIPDLPGSGRSALAGETSMESLAEVLKQVMDDAGIPACTMIGHSMGGYITLAFAEKYPDALTAFGLFHSTSYPDNEEKKTARRKGIEFIGQHGAAKFLEQATPNLFAGSFRAKYPDKVQEIIGRFTNFSAQSLVSYYEAMMQRPDRTQVIKDFTRPILFIGGAFDTAVPPEHSLQQCHLPGLSYIHILKQSGHMGMLEEAATSTALLERFLQHGPIA
jgi:pimeloyl-ACP methyl ester carboxylesterase